MIKISLILHDALPAVEKETSQLQGVSTQGSVSTAYRIGSVVIEGWLLI